MKFVFLSHYDANLYLFRLPIMKALVAKGHKVVAICPKGNVSCFFAEHNIDYFDILIDRSNLNPVHESSVIFRLAGLIRRISPDVLHTFTAKPNIYGTVAGRIARVPIIYNLVEGLGSLYVEDSPRNRVIRGCMEAFYAISCRMSDATVFVNQEDSFYFTKKNIISKQKVRIIRSVGIDTQIFDPNKFDKSYKLFELGIKPSTKVVLMVARAIWHKGVAEYIEAARILRTNYPNVIFILAGDIDPGNPSSVSSEILHDNLYIRWIGPRTDIAELTALSDVCVLPSYREGVPRTLLEAASMAKPIVTTDTVGCREVVEDGINGILVPVKDSKALAQGIATLLDDPGLRKRMGRAGRDKAVREFDVRMVVRQYLELYGVNS